MKRSDLSDLAAFAAVATHRSFRRAAVDLGLSPSALSHALRGLETRMGVRLLHRTTRSVAVTETGGVLLDRLGPALAEIADAMNIAAAAGEALSGPLRINAPHSACRFVLMPLIAPFLARHPGIGLEIISDNALTDVVAAGCDAGIRLGEHLAQDMIAVRCSGPQRMALVASPAYLAARGCPDEPRDLSGHACIRQRFPGGSLYRWEFEKNGRDVTIAVDGPLILTDQEMMVRAAIDGAGLALVFEGYLGEAVARGQLVRVMDDWCPPFPGFFLYYAGGRQMPATLRAFVDFLKDATLTATP